MKLGAWMVMLVVMILFISFIGIAIPGLNPIPQAFGLNVSSNSTVINADVENSGVWSVLFGESAFTLFGVSFSKGILVALIGIAVIVIGLFAKGYDVSLVILPIVAFVGGLFISAFWAVISYTIQFNQIWLTGIITLILGGLAVGFVMSLVDYFSGR